MENAINFFRRLFRRPTAQWLAERQEVDAELSTFTANITANLNASLNRLYRAKP